MTKEEFIEKARKIHGDKYDYSEVVYKNNKTNVWIICPIHGGFWQTPKNHLKGCNCPRCAGQYKKTPEEFIKQARKVHGDKYDYSKVVYKDGKSKVTIICPVHGEFEQIANNHLKGEGCIKCRNDKMKLERRGSVESFIRRAKEIYGDKYDYSKVQYVDGKTNICIICPKHGEFWKKPYNFLSGHQGCPKCTIEEREKNKKPKEIIIKKTPKEIFIEKAKSLYGDKYDYSKVEYINSGVKVCIICPKHGEFWKRPDKFLQGQECGLCKEESRIEKIRNEKDKFIEKARKVHGDKYDYSEVDYNGTQKRVKIICNCKDKNGNEHGIFEQIANSHLRGCGCPICAQELRTEKSKKTTEKFISEAKEMFPEYDYSKTVYIDQTTPVIITCHKKYKNGKEHGDFTVIPNKLLNRGTHCPHCTTQTSYPEKEIYSYVVEKIGVENVKFHERGILNGEEIDIYIPSKKLGIEYNGLFWHSEYNEHISKNSHLIKTERCEKQGIHLIQIFGDEYSEKREIILSKINHLLGIDYDKLKKIQARKCEIKHINWDVASNFENKFHIQGSAVATVYLGAFYDEELVAVMTFVKEKKNIYCLNRFASNYNYICQGVASKMFKYFLKEYNPIEVKSFADRRYSKIDNNMYNKIGFKFDKTIRPDYRYIYKNKPSLGRFHKFNFRKQVLHKKYGLPLSMTENEMTKQLGYGKIYDCGLIKYIWRNNNINEKDKQI